VEPARGIEPPTFGSNCHKTHIVFGSFFRDEVLATMESLPNGVRWIMMRSGNCSLRNQAKYPKVPDDTQGRLNRWPGKNYFYKSEELST